LVLLSAWPENPGKVCPVSDKIVLYNERNIIKDKLIRQAVSVQEKARAYAQKKYSYIIIYCIAPL
jgi:hypothetical protein